MVKSLFKKKPFRSKICKICDKKYTPVRTLQPCCNNIDCMIEYTSMRREKENKRKILNIEKARKKKNAKRKKEFYDNDLRTRKEAAKTWCHKYIRARDKGKPCICCNRPPNKKMDAGHFLESGNNPRIRYDEDNIHSQLVYCNQYQGGDSGDYEANLREKIGSDKIDKLKSMKGGVVKRTCDDYREIEEYFKDKYHRLISGE